jgi:hypothetical protein
MTERQRRAELAWVLAGFAVVQFGIALAVDQLGWQVRDPEFSNLFRDLEQRRAEAPDHPLVLVLGSSRTALGLRPDRLQKLTLADNPLVYNFGLFGGGPMLEQLVVRRLLDAGIRPDLLVAEVMPMSLSWRDGSPIEERYVEANRYSINELTQLKPYYHEVHWLFWGWGRGRLLPCYCHQAELRALLGLDLPVQERPADCHPSSFGWRSTGPAGTPEETEARIRWYLQHYGPALADPRLAPGPTQAFCDLLLLCRQHQLPVILVIPPEDSHFRSYQPAVEENQVQCVAQLAHQFGLTLVDARAWVQDDGFVDGHHLSREGAETYTIRLGREVLQPYLARLANGLPLRAFLRAGMHLCVRRCV